MKPMLDPKTHLAGATPKTLAKALLRTRHRTQTVVGGKISSKQVSVSNNFEPISTVTHRYQALTRFVRIYRELGNGDHQTRSRVVDY